MFISTVPYMKLNRSACNTIYPAKQKKKPPTVTPFFFFFSGVIFYAMILGRLPFRTPFKDEYQRQRMLDQIQKGLGSFHEREMSGLITGK